MQITDLLLKAVKIGNEFTVTDETANEADKQPKLLVPITEYELVIEGETMYNYWLQLAKEYNFVQDKYYHYSY